MDFGLVRSSVGGGRDARLLVYECERAVTVDDLMRPLHDRMPVILDAKDFDRWLDAATQDPARLQPLLAPYCGSELTAYPISTFVNSPRNQGPKCIEPVADGK
jgi:putative SOS response-associated peptidase YedK